MSAPAYREWVEERVLQARQCFSLGRQYLAQVESLRCRLAGYAYIARFEWMAYAIERDGFLLREAYPERKSIQAGLWMVSRTVASLSGLFKPAIGSHELAAQPIHYEER